MSVERDAGPHPAALHAIDLPAPARTARRPALRRRRSARLHPFRGWLVVAGAFLVVMVGYGAIYSHAAFADEIAAEFGATRSRVSLIFALSGDAPPRAPAQPPTQEDHHASDPDRHRARREPRRRRARE